MQTSQPNLRDPETETKITSARYKQQMPPDLSRLKIRAVTTETVTTEQILYGLALLYSPEQSRAEGGTPIQTVKKKSHVMHQSLRGVYLQTIG